MHHLGMCHPPDVVLAGQTPRQHLCSHNVWSVCQCKTDYKHNPPVALAGRFEWHFVSGCVPKKMTAGSAVQAGDNFSLINALRWWEWTLRWGVRQQEITQLQIAPILIGLTVHCNLECVRERWVILKFDIFLKTKKQKSNTVSFKVGPLLTALWRKQAVGCCCLDKDWVRGCYVPS